ncbi:hypothetical protein [Parafilimonas sp.]|uniref:hypothetical protein n=1 Tax=Parafilimonas sp. TaxID=1969739 RepID=UPI0039E2B055
MKKKIMLFAVILMPVLVFSQTARKGWYGSLGLGYGSYKLDLYNYNSGSDSYADQSFSQPLIRLGVEKKSIINKGGFVLDADAELTGGFGLKTRSTLSGPTTKNENKGWSLGINGLVKAGYVLGKESTSITPLIGLGPHFISLQTGSGDEGFSNKIYGLQGFIGIDFNLSKITMTPNMHVGIANWGSSDRWIGSADNAQNGQPSMFEAGINVAVRL